MDLKIPEILSSQQQAVEFTQVHWLCFTFHERCMWGNFWNIFSKTTAVPDFHLMKAADTSCRCSAGEACWREQSGVGPLL